MHGHFYQPPREDPWTGLVEIQDSAAPFSDWNKRITAECYAACGASRVLDENGGILSIVNVYETLSFNFGPTLLSWLETEAPEAYKRILQADQTSFQRLGHGNAIAQSYNHTILPLDTPEDAKTQIRWGLTDFQHRFGRKAEGMWLPECGANPEVLGYMVEEGLKFAILSPWQAKALSLDGQKWNDLEENPAPSDRPFWVHTPSGPIAVFFYHPDLASSISFGHLLQSKEGLSHALEKALDQAESPMVSIATDGEIYGHHEPFGDMCLAALVDEMQDSPRFEFTNYGAYLEASPPQEWAQLREGDEQRGSSWSCAHGVGRWMRDCGCNTGGEAHWNQQWREPLRKSLETLRELGHHHWLREMEGLGITQPLEILNHYGQVLCGNQAPQKWAKSIIGEDEQKQSALLRLLEGAKYLRFAFTSCGWFFSEISGIEPVQNLRYAVRAAELLDPDGTKELLTSLTRALTPAQSNIRGMGNGADILTRMALPSLPPEARAAALFFWHNLYNLPWNHNQQRWGIWELCSFSQRTIDVNGPRLCLLAQLTYQDIQTLTRQTLQLEAIVDQNLFCPEVNIQLGTQTIKVPIAAMPTKLRQMIQKTLLKRSEKKLMRFMDRQAMDRIRDKAVVETLELPFGASGWQSLELALHYAPMRTLSKLKKTPLENWDRPLDRLEYLLEQREKEGIDTGRSRLEHSAARIATLAAERLLKQSNSQTLPQLVRFINLAHRYDLKPLRPQLQNAVYTLLKQNLRKDSKGRTNPELCELAGLLNINPIRFLKEN